MSDKVRVFVKYCTCNEGWKQNCSKCYWIKKEIELFRFQPSVLNSDVEFDTAVLFYIFVSLSMNQMVWLLV